MVNYSFKLMIVLLCLTGGAFALFGNELKQIFRSGVLNVNLFKCLIKNPNICPHPDVTFRVYAPKGYRKGLPLNLKIPFTLYAAGFSKHRETVFIIHGFNGTENDRHIQYLRDAYLSRNFNVISVDWRPLTQYPCYLTALVNTRLAAQCSAQVYAFMTHHGALREKMTCVGHSLGAHVCGMMSNHLTTKQYRIIGLDPARPLIERKKSDAFRLTKDDATHTQIVHTNAGALGQTTSNAHLNFCVNGGKYQPYCKGHRIKRTRCSHFLSICYLANAVFKNKKFLGVPCPQGCTIVSGPHRLPVSNRNPFEITSQLKEFQIGTDAPDGATGTYCIDVGYAKHCPFGDEIVNSN